jgi:asparagine synthase (glutamine-hydrolysing)
LKRFAANANRNVDEMYYCLVAYLDTARKTELLADRKDLLGANAAPEEFEFLASIRSRHARLPMRDAAPLVDLESFLPQNVLAYGDRMSMAHALEVRVPFCDHHLVESLAPLPLATKIPGGVPKGMLRWAMRRDLPARVLYHRKVGFNPPIAQWLRGPLAPVVDEYLSDRSLRNGPLFAWRTVGELCRRFRSGHDEMAHSIWSIIVVEAWLRWLSRQGSLGTSAV